MSTELIIEQGTNYAYSVNYMDNKSFSSLRSIAKVFLDRLPQTLIDELYESLERGVCQIDNEPALNMYMYALGSMHEAKLRHAFDHLSDEILNHNKINIIDYGCGQGIASICYADFLREKRIGQTIQEVVLVEPSIRALQRAALHVKKFFNDTNIITVNKDFDKLIPNDIHIKSDVPTIHLFSNVIDLGDKHYDLNKFSKTVSSILNEKDHVVCIGPFFDCTEIDDKIDKFLNGLISTSGKKLQAYHSEMFRKGEFKDDKSWSCRVLIASTTSCAEAVDKLIDEGIEQ